MASLPAAAMGLTPLLATEALVGMTLLLSTLEYAILGLLVGRAVQGRRLRRLAAARGWTWRRGDPRRTLAATAPRVLAGRVRRRHVRQTLSGDTPQGRFLLWIHRGGWRPWQRRQATVLVATRTPPAAHPLFVAATDGAPHPWRHGPDAAGEGRAAATAPDLVAWMRRHPRFAWDWAGTRLVVSSTHVKTMDDLQDLIHAADRFRALVPGSPPWSEGEPFSDAAVAGRPTRRWPGVRPGAAPRASRSPVPAPPAP